MPSLSLRTDASQPSLLGTLLHTLLLDLSYALIKIRTLVSESVVLICGGVGQRCQYKQQRCFVLLGVRPPTKFQNRKLCRRFSLAATRQCVLVHGSTCRYSVDVERIHESCNTLRSIFEPYSSFPVVAVASHLRQATPY